MSTDRHSEETNEERLIEELFAEWNSGVGEAPESIERLRRDYHELLGLLPYALEPVSGEPASRERLLELAAQARPNAESAAPLSFSGRPAEGGEPPARGRRWLLPIAAAFALAAVGVSGWQFGQLREQQATIEELAGHLSAVNVGTTRLATDCERLDELNAHVAMVTTPGTELCSLEPAGEQPLHPAAKATFAVSADRLSWYLRVEGLDPCPQGGIYQVWFHTDDGMVSAGTFDVGEPGAKVEILDHSVPSSIRAVQITLEAGAGVTQPTGPSVLFGDGAMRVL